MKYVKHDGRIWGVVGDTMLDDDPAYELRISGPNMKTLDVVARVSDTEAMLEKPRKRRLKDGGYVLEIDSRGNVTMREKGRRKRYETSLAALYSMTVKAHVAMQKALKAIAKRKGKRR